MKGPDSAICMLIFIFRGSIDQRALGPHRRKPQLFKNGVPRSTKVVAAPGGIVEGEDKGNAGIDKKEWTDRCVESLIRGFRL